MNPELVPLNKHYVHAVRAYLVRTLKHAKSMPKKDLIAGVSYHHHHHHFQQFVTNFLFFPSRLRQFNILRIDLRLIRRMSNG